MDDQRQSDKQKPQKDIEKMLEELEGSPRKVAGVMAVIIAAIAISMSCFHLYTAGFGILEAMNQRVVHLTFALMLTFLIFPLSKNMRQKGVPWYDVLLALAGLAVGAYIIINYRELMMRGGDPLTIDLVFGGICILLVLEATRRVVGKPLVILAILFLFFAYFGPYVPEPFAHRGADVARIIDHLYLTTEGIFAIPLGVSATYIIIFILFGSILEATGAGKMFIDLAMALFGWMRGGPAKAAVVSSGLMGSISGSSVANAVTTGTFTISLMKKVGFKPHVAGAVEVAASSSGQLMPPVMGAAAFIMAEYTNIPYLEIVKAAAIPCILSYTAILFMVHLEAVKSGIKGIPRDELPPLKQVLLAKGHMVLPFFVLIGLLIYGYTPLMAGFAGIVSTIVLSFLKKETRLTWCRFLRALELGARNSLGVALACATAGIIVGVVTLTGLGLKLSSIIIQLAGGHLWLTLVFTMIASMILGLGLPTTATYVVLAAITAPALLEIGVPLLAAHLFVFYFGILADDTPPVNLPAFATAGIANANPVLTGVTGFKFDCGALLLPYIFATNTALLLIDTTWWQALQVIITSFIGILAFTAGIQNYLLARAKIWERLLLFTAAIVLVHADLITDLIGICIFALVILLQKLRIRKKPGIPAEITSEM
ncbi:MAG: TRAP transporter permease [Peptococcaceae bacterium]|nr:TRAP transporter permease [Peptococcaceae bacterium]